MNSRGRLSAENVAIRFYRNGDDARIVHLLNLCYGGWGVISKWQGLYTRYPTFGKDNVFIIENKNQIIGYRGLRFRDLVVREDHKILTASLSDTAIHPRFRGLGLYTKLHKITLERAKSRGACLAFAWNLKGSTTYNHNKKTGFVEIKQIPAYIKIINPGKVLKSGLSDFIRKNQRMKNALQSLKSDLYFDIGDTEFSVGELLGETAQHPKVNRQKVNVSFDKSSLSLITKFRTSGGLQRIANIVLLLLHRKIRIRFDSFGGFVKFARKGVLILASL